MIWLKEITLLLKLFKLAIKLFLLKSIIVYFEQTHVSGPFRWSRLGQHISHICQNDVTSQNRYENYFAVLFKLLLPAWYFLSKKKKSSFAKSHWTKIVCFHDRIVILRGFARIKINILYTYPYVIVIDYLCSVVIL